MEDRFGGRPLWWKAALVEGRLGGRPPWWYTKAGPLWWVCALVCHQSALRLGGAHRSGVRLGEITEADSVLVKYTKAECALVGVRFGVLTKRMRFGSTLKRTAPWCSHPPYHQSGLRFGVPTKAHSHQSGTPKRARFGVPLKRTLSPKRTHTKAHSASVYHQSAFA